MPLIFSGRFSLEKCEKIGRFSRRLLPDWGITTRAATTVNEYSYLLFGILWIYEVGITQFQLLQICVTSKMQFSTESGQ